MDNREYDDTIVMLECFQMSCRYRPDATGIIMKYKDYQPGVHLCPNCGAEMITREQDRAEMELLELGINPFIRS